MCLERLDRRGYFNADAVLPGRLYLGNLSDVEAAPQNVTHVLTVAARLRAEDHLSAAVQKHTTVAVDDHPCADILSVLPQALAFIDEALPDLVLTDDQIVKAPHPRADNGVSLTASSGSGAADNHPAILVHCASGVSRSTTAIVA